MVAIESVAWFVSWVMSLISLFPSEGETSKERADRENEHNLSIRRLEHDQKMREYNAEAEYKLAQKAKK